jgi:hypothetical protein
MDGAGPIPWALAKFKQDIPRDQFAKYMGEDVPPGEYCVGVCTHAVMHV